jgi:hypothetical protein
VSHKISLPQAIVEQTHQGIPTVLWWYHCPHCPIEGRAAMGPNQKRLTQQLGQKHLAKDHADLL